MRLFKPISQGKPTRKWYIEFRDHYGIVRKMAIFSEKSNTQKAADRIEQLVICRMNSESPDKSLSEWLDRLEPSIKKRLAKFDIIDKRRFTTANLLSQHVEDFKLSLGDTRNTRQLKNALLRVFSDCGFQRYSDISASKLQTHLKSLDQSQRTRNYYLKSVKQFCHWMIKDRRASENPVAYLSCEIITKREIVRRAFTTAEMQCLLGATERQPERFNMTGHERALLYRLAAESGLRYSELASLTVASFGLRFESIAVTAAYSKGKKNSVLPLKDETAALLKEHLKGKLPNCQAFNMPTDKGAEMIQLDMSAARASWIKENQIDDHEHNDFLKYTDSAGRRADFHALRHTFGTMLAASGVHPKVAQELMRHSTIDLTMNIYTHVLGGQTSAAVNGLPSLSAPTKEGVRHESA